MTPFYDLSQIEVSAARSETDVRLKWNRSASKTEFNAIHAKYKRNVIGSQRLLVGTDEEQQNCCWVAKTGSNRAPNTATIFDIVIVFRGFHCSKMANFDSRTYSNTFGWFLDLPTNRQNLDPRAPYLSPKYFKTYKKIWEHPWNIFFISENLQFWICWKVCVPNFLNSQVWSFDLLKFRNFYFCDYGTTIYHKTYKNMFGSL